MKIKNITKLAAFALTIIMSTSSLISPAFAYNFPIALRSDKWLKIVEAYGDYYSGGYPNMGEEAVVTASMPFSSLASPSWSKTSDWAYKTIKNDANFSKIKNTTFAIEARTIYAENANISSANRKKAMDATAQVIWNRANANTTAFGGSDTREVCLKAGQFSCWTDGNMNVSNPVYYNNDMEYWIYACELAFHMYQYDSVPNPLGTNKIYHFYDTQAGMPFYTDKNASSKCTLSNVTSAKYYLTGSTYNPITSPRGIHSKRY